MKWIKTLMFLSMALAIVSCSSDDDFTDDVAEEDSVETPDEEEVVIGKRGAAYTNRRENWSHQTAKLKPHWMYSWGNVMADEIPENVEFVPMIWGRGAAESDDVINRMKQLKNEGKVKYLLGFNEPDNPPQANMTVEEAIALWPRLEEVGLPLGSPATVQPDNDWMKDFMAQAEQLDYRIDFINMHHYGGTSVPALINKLRTTYNDYGERPIWIKEFAVADWQATSPSANVHSVQSVVQFMDQALNALEEIPYVHRYAWFDTRNQAPLYTSKLFIDEEENLSLSPVGDFYSNFKPNEMTGPGMDTEFEVETPDGELIINGGFETGQISPWGGFKNGVAGTNATEPNSGNFSGRIENNDGSLFQIVEVESGKTYELTYFTKWRDPVTNTFSGAIRDEDAEEVIFTMDDIAMSTEWTEGNFEFTVPDGVSTIRVVFFKPQVDPPHPPIFFDDISLREKED